MLLARPLQSSRGISRIAFSISSGISGGPVQGSMFKVPTFALITDRSACSRFAGKSTATVGEQGQA
jgi:hypothetical protein